MEIFNTRIKNWERIPLHFLNALDPNSALKPEEIAYPVKNKNVKRNQNTLSTNLRH